MKVKDLIKLLNDFDGELDVCPKDDYATQEITEVLLMSDEYDTLVILKLT